MNCEHTDTVPVYGYAHPNPPKVGDTVALLNGGRPLAHLCLTCDQQLPASWGCPDCTWDAVVTRRLCDPTSDITHVCTRRCTTHQEAHPVNHAIVEPPDCEHSWQPYYAVGLPWPPPADAPHTSICIVCKTVRTDTEEAHP